MQVNARKISLLVVLKYTGCGCHHTGTIGSLGGDTIPTCGVPVLSFSHEVGNSVQFVLCSACFCRIWSSRLNDDHTGIMSLLVFLNARQGVAAQSPSQPILANEHDNSPVNFFFFHTNVEVIILIAVLCIFTAVSCANERKHDPC